MSNELRGRDNETSKMNGVRRATQASLPHIHIHTRPYGCLANFFLKDHNRVPMDCCGKVEIHERKCQSLIVYIVMNLLVITHIFWASAMKQQTRLFTSSAVCKAELFKVLAK